jgi:isopentenyldiphosphate isomerase
MPDAGDEQVDVVDDAGNTIGVVTRREMRARRLPHRSTYILVFNSRGELFIHQRTASKDVFPSFWDVAVGGVLGAGESFDLGAKRELAEELGIDAEPERLFPIQISVREFLVFGMVYRVTHDGPFRFQPEEVSQGDFVPSLAVETLTTTRAFCPDGLQVWAEYRRRRC